MYKDNHKKYLKYKKKYEKLTGKKMSIGGSDYEKYKKSKKMYVYAKKIFGFYFFHTTKDVDRLKKILKDGYLRIGGELIRGNEHFGSEKSDSVYMTMYFEDLKNLTHMLDVGILLHPKVISEYNSTFNKGWGFSPNYIKIDKTDSMKVLGEKISKVKEFVKSPMELPEIIRAPPGYWTHEILFNESINLDNNNLIGIMCNYCDHKVIEEIKSIIATKPYKDVKIFTRNYPFPKINKLF